MKFQLCCGKALIKLFNSMWIQSETENAERLGGLCVCGIWVIFIGHNSLYKPKGQLDRVFDVTFCYSSQNDYNQIEPKKHIHDCAGEADLSICNQGYHKTTTKQTIEIALAFAAIVVWFGHVFVFDRCVYCAESAKRLGFIDQGYHFRILFNI